MKKNILIVGLTAVLLGCTGQEQKTATATAPQLLPPDHPPIEAMKQQVSGTLAMEAPGGKIRGEILETMNAGGYTYMRLGTEHGDVWTAVRETNVKKGATVTVEVPQQST